jgi:hypothetical protein
VSSLFLKYKVSLPTRISFAAKQEVPWLRYTYLNRKRSHNITAALERTRLDIYDRYNLIYYKQQCVFLHVVLLDAVVHAQELYEILCVTEHLKTIRLDAQPSLLAVVHALGREMWFGAVSPATPCYPK